MAVFLILSTSIFSMYLHVIGNDTLMNSFNSDNGSVLLLYTFAAIIVIYSFLFMMYIYQYTIEKDMKSIGLSISMGYSKQSIVKLLLYKFTVTYFTSVIVGIVIGRLIYQLFILYLNKQLDFDFNGTTDLSSYGLTVIIFLIVYVVNGGKTLLHLYQLETQEIIQYKKTIKPVKNENLLYHLGSIILIGAFAILVFSRGAGTDISIVNTALPLLAGVMGTYLLTLSFGGRIIKFIRNRYKSYYKQLIFLGNIKLNYKNYARLLGSSSIVLLFCVFIAIFIIGIRSDMGVDKINYNKPYDLIADMEQYSEEDQSKINDFEMKYKEDIVHSDLIEISEAKIAWDTEEYDRPIFIMPERSYVQLTDKELTVSKGGIVVLSQIDKSKVTVSVTDGKEWNYIPVNEEAPFQLNSQIYRYTIEQEIWEILFNLPNETVKTYILNDEDYSTCKQDMDSMSMKYFLVLRETADAETISNELGRMFPGAQITTRNKSYINELTEKKMMLFVVVLTEALMIFSLLGMQIIKLLQNGKFEKELYRNLYTLGFSKLQLKYELKKELLLFFYLPSVSGGLIGGVFTLFFIRDIDYTLVIALLVVLIFLIAINFIAYKISGNILYKSLIDRIE